MVFVQIRVEDVINVSPDKFGEDYKQAITDRIGDKYVGAILPKPVNGLVVALFELERVGDKDNTTGYIFPGDNAVFFGDVSYKCIFTLVVFQPKVNELFTAQIESQDEQGLLLDLEFIKVPIPSQLLMQPAVYDKVQEMDMDILCKKSGLQKMQTLQIVSSNFNDFFQFSCFFNRKSFLLLKFCKFLIFR